MSEITKLYENAGTKKDRMCEWTCKGSELCSPNCEHYGSMQLHYPPFTAEKQIEICKFLLKAEHSISYYFYENRYGFVIDDKQDDCIEAEKFKTVLAMIVNNLWQDLTLEEKQQIKEILEC